VPALRQFLSVPNVYNSLPFPDPPENRDASAFPRTQSEAATQSFPTAAPEALPPHIRPKGGLPALLPRTAPRFLHCILSLYPTFLFLVYNQHSDSLISGALLLWNQTPGSEDCPFSDLPSVLPPIFYRYVRQRNRPPAPPFFHKSMRKTEGIYGILC